MGLQEYHAKRNFRRTREPKGSGKTRRGWLYVVQKHDATRLHYDFRLQLGDVLLSWAVPKGPSLDPTIKRLAMHVEDHPVEYGSFEGIIPEGEYGGGTVMLWDRGHWAPEGDPAESYRQGKLKFRLHGEKLRGEWLLVRSGGHRAGERAWLLFKVNDEYARPENKYDVTVEEPDSVKTGRTLAEIAKAEDSVWSSNRANSETKRAAHLAAARTLSRMSAAEANGRAGQKKTRTRGVAKKGRPAKTLPAKRRAAKPPEARAKASRKTVRGNAKSKANADRHNRTPPSDLPGAVKATFSSVVGRIHPQLATLVRNAPTGSEWLHEIKFDGYRMVCRKNGQRVELVSRNDIDWTARFAWLADAVRALKFDQAILDGEVCALRPDGRSDFQELQNAMKAGRAQKMVYYVFDVLFADGYDLTRVPLLQRKRYLQRLVSRGKGNIVYSAHVVGNGDDYFREACRLGLEGIISKRSDRPFYAGRSADWLKVKCQRREEFVVGGFTDPAGSRIGFGSLLVGYHDDERRLRYAGRVGTGFDTSALRQLTARLESLEQNQSPFADLRTKTGDARHAHWVMPKLVAQVEFTEWTADGRLRHPSFQGLREDKLATEVVRDRPASLSALGVEWNGNPHADHQKPKRNTAAKPNIRASSAMRTKARAKTKAAMPAHAADTVAGVRLTSPDKVLYPEQGITKLELARYYEQIADWVLPELVNRPLVLVRCPEGRHKECFYQKHPGAGVTDQLRQIPVREKSGNEKYLVADDIVGVVSLVQMGVLEIHAWGSRADRIEQPDRLIFDLDPDPTVKLDRLVESAFQVREFLAALDLRSFVKTTGGKGLHVVVPVARKLDWDDVKEFTRQVATAIVHADPERYTANMSKKARIGRIFIDYLRNGRGASAIVPYSSRAREGCPVAMPVDWSELKSLKAANQFNIKNAIQRLKTQRKNPWSELGTLRQSITVAAQKRLAKLVPA
jgi:bifunctional non-homologous end joining protein LigD